ncbi:hypothetical protein BD289DRAFT_453979 [Coniella lustricola]|uniref:Zn(2)-C6 fungal-type domain-containing protein n=1 Tax=Coniella lustricola TaxID=2025994 RepID=A0A2T3A5A3_9PEZI|nr:hypothetical protein BD289DRAFT_453979 [Coniella lustricola]
MLPALLALLLLLIVVPSAYCSASHDPRPACSTSEVLTPHYSITSCSDSSDLLPISFAMVAAERDSVSRLASRDAVRATMPVTPPAEPAEHTEHDEKPYHAKRPHRKSRLGCRNCKARKVKCDEQKPTCGNCTLRKESCDYPAQSRAASRAGPRPSTPATPAAAAAPASTPRCPVSAVSWPSVSSASPLLQHTTTASKTSTSLLLAQRSPIALTPQSTSRAHWRDSPSSDDEHEQSELIIVDEPPVTLGTVDQYDMKLLWFYTTETYSSFSVEAGKIPDIDSILKSQIVRFAFQSPFLMDCILALSAQHMQFLKIPVPVSRLLTYRTRAFAGYRQAIEHPNPRDYPALLSCSLLLCALSSEVFRERDMKRLYILDWMTVWRGIGLIFEFLPADMFYQSGLEKLFQRPEFDLNQAALHIPPNLLFMITSIKPDDPDYPDVHIYYDTLKYLGGLYRELEAGFSPVLSLRVITWFTFLPKPFIQLAKERRPRTLIILAHYLLFLKLIENVWWLYEISYRAVQDILDYLPPQWQAYLNVPRLAIHVEDRVELAKLIQGNHAWEPFTERTEALPVRKMVNDNGEEVLYDKERGWVPISKETTPEPSTAESNAQSKAWTPVANRSQHLSPPQS